MKKNTIALTILLLSLSVGHSQTIVSGGIYFNTSWTLAGSPYIVAGNVTLFPGYTLTIEPGVTVKFADATNLTIRGTLSAVGSIADTIYFTSNNSAPIQGDWDKISVETWNGGIAQFKFCKIAYAYHGIDIGYGFGGSGPILLSRTQFYKNQVGTFGYASFTWHIDSCVFINNYAAVQSAYCVIRNSSFINNSDGIESIPVSLYYCYFCGNGNAITADTGPIRHCIITNNNVGVQAYYELNDVDSNIIVRNVIGVKLSTNLGVNNTICNNSTYNIENRAGNNLSVANNCFCSTDSAYIAGTIYDGYDNISLGLLDFTPFISCDSASIPGNIDCSTSLTGIYYPNSSGNLFLITVFPNPFSSVTILHTDKSFNDATLTVYNTCGMNVKQIQNISGNTITFQRDNLPGGVYFFQLSQANKTIAIDKLVITDH